MDNFSGYIPVVQSHSWETNPITKLHGETPGFPSLLLVARYKHGATFSVSQSVLILYRAIAQGKPRNFPQQMEHLMAEIPVYHQEFPVIFSEKMAAAAVDR